MKNKKTPLALAINALFPPEHKDVNMKETFVSKNGTSEDRLSFANTDAIQNNLKNNEFLKNEQKLDWNIAEIKQKISEFSCQGKLSSELLDVLCKDGFCAPIEFECLDYKERIEKTSYAKAKLVLQVVSFYNTFGGYLVFGVAESESEIQFDIIGIQLSELDIESLKALIKEYTGERIQVTLMPLEAINTKYNRVSIAVLHIPKRPQATPPLHFLKNGPGNDKKKPIFLKDEVY